MIVLADPVAIVIDHLLDQSEVTSLCGTRIYGRLPENTTWPAVRVTRYDGQAVFPQPRMFEEAFLQVDAFGDFYDCDDIATRLLAETCAAALADRLPMTMTDTWTVTTARVGSTRDDPDDTWSPARPRSLFDLTVYVRSR